MKKLEEMGLVPLNKKECLNTMVAMTSLSSKVLNLAMSSYVASIFHLWRF